MHAFCERPEKDCLLVASGVDVWIHQESRGEARVYIIHLERLPSSGTVSMLDLPCLLLVPGTGSRCYAATMS